MDLGLLSYDNGPRPACEVTHGYTGMIPDFLQHRAVEKVNIVAQAITPHILLIHSLNHSLHKSAYSPIHNPQKLTTNVIATFSSNSLSIVLFLSNIQINPFSYVIYVNLYSIICVYICVQFMCVATQRIS